MDDPQVADAPSTSNIKDQKTRLEIPKLVNLGRAAYYHFDKYIKGAWHTLDLVKEAGDKTSDLVMTYSVMRTIKDHLDEAMKAIEKQVEMVNTIRAPEAFEREGVKTITTEDGDRATLDIKLYASIAAEKREEAFTWLRENGHAALITEVINSGTLSAWARAEIKENRDVPEELFTTHQKAGLSLTRSKKSKAEFGAG